MIGYVLTSPLCDGARHLHSVARMLISGQDIAAHLNSIIMTEGERLPSWVRDGFNQYVALEPETRNSAVFNLNIALNPWNNRLVAAATSTSDFDIRELRRTRMSIFIGCSVAQLDAFRPLLNILVQQIHDVLMMAPPGQDEPHQVLVLIDEFRQLGRMDDLVSKLTINAGFRFRVVIVLQNLAQLDEVYGRAVRETILAACATQLYIRIDDLDTCEYLSKMLGQTTIELKRASLRRGGMFGSKTINIDYDAVPLRTPQQLRQMDPRKIILLVASAPPFELARVIYHDDHPYRRALKQVRFKSVEAPELEPYADPAPGPKAGGPPVTAKALAKPMAGAVLAPASTRHGVPHSVHGTSWQDSGPAPHIVERHAADGWPRPALALSQVDAQHMPSGPARPRSENGVAIDAVLAAQIEAGAAAFRTVMEGLPEDGAHSALLAQLQQMAMLHHGFGEDGTP